MGDPCLMWFKRGLWFLLVCLCLCLLKENKLRLPVLYISFVIQMIIKPILFSTLNVSKCRLTVLLAHYLLFYMYTFVCLLYICILFVISYTLICLGIYVIR